MTRQIAAIMYWLTLISSASIADDLTIPNTFQANTPARAADVNANFDAVEASVDDNAADISANTAAIATNESGIQTVTAAVNALADGSTGLSVLFFNPNPNQYNCEFIRLPSRDRFAWDIANQRIVMRLDSGGNYMFILTGIATLDDAKPLLVDLMIRIGNLPLVVDDFRDQTTNEFDCSNEKLLSLL